MKNIDSDLLLDIYFRKLLEAVAVLPPQYAYKILPFTGHLFRDFQSYACGYDPGVLISAAGSMKDAQVSTSRNMVDSMNEYLRFESRYVLENIWIRKECKRHVLGSFYRSDIQALKTFMREQNYVVVTAHVSGLLSIVELLRIIGYPTPLIASNIFNQVWENAKPIQKSMYLLYKSWIKRQPLFFSDDKNLMDKCCQTLSSGKSVILAADVPGYDEKGVKVPMFGKKIWVPPGSAKLSYNCGIPILVAIPWTDTCDKPYRILFERISVNKNYSEVMGKIYHCIETVVKLNPANWNGWLYFDKMVAE